ncbi:MAG: WG repeat-containing protein [Bacteroidaceae bacterium]|nr:WG repeat-containing protein [Bacteroidaceae bacterium]
MRDKKLITLFVACFTLLSIATSHSYAQTINASFAQKIAQYSELGVFSCGLARVKKAGKWGFIDKSGNEIVECIYDDVDNYHDFMALVRNHDGKNGYVDNMGDLVIPCKYRYAQYFSEGLAWVNDDGPWRCIDHNGKVVFTLEIMSEERSNFKNGISVITPPDGTSSIIKKKGEVIDLKGRSWLGGGISDGLILCNVNNGEEEKAYDVYLDADGNVVIDCRSHEGNYWHNPFVNGLAPVVDMENQKVGYIDKTGKFVIPPTLPFYGIRNVDEDPFYCFDGMIRTVKKFGDEDSFDFGLKYGFVDSTGNLVIPYTYTDAYDFSGGLAAVRDNNGKWGYVNKNGNLVIPYTYTDAYDFSGGLAAVRDNNGKWGFINKNGDLVIPYKYDAVFYGFQDGFAKVVIGNKQGYVDKNGNDTFSTK